MIERNRLRNSLLDAAPGFAALADASRKDDDGVDRPRWFTDLERFGEPPHKIGLEQREIHGEQDRNRDGGAGSRSAVQPPQTILPSGGARSLGLQLGVDQRTHLFEAALPAIRLGDFNA